MMNKPRPHPPAAQRGAAALIVVMLLFFVISLVAAYAGRNLIFEQKTSANQYRATQAAEAAEAGLEWALAMLNGGRIDASCVPPSPMNGSSDFRQRYLVSDADGNLAPRLWADGLTRERPSCVQNGDGWNCSCPSGAAPAPTIPADTLTHPVFQVCFEAVNPPQPGAIRVLATGRTGFVDQTCEAPAEGSDGDAAAVVSMVVALSSALPMPPSAALTTVGNITTNYALTLTNTDPASNGLTAVHGGVLSEPVPITHHSAPGSPNSAAHILDASLTGRLPQDFFRSIFGMPVPTYQAQPAVVRCAAPCGGALQQLVEANPGRIIWIDGDLVLNAALDLSGVDPPVLIVASGNMTLAAPLKIRGLLYSQGNISTHGGGTQIVGAVIAAGNFTVFDGTAITYDPAVLQQLKSTGSLVRVPGSWRDFP